MAGDVDHSLLDTAELDRLISQTELLCVLCSEPCGIVTGNDSGSVIETCVNGVDFPVQILRFLYVDWRAACCR